MGQAQGLTSNKENVDVDNITWLPSYVTKEFSSCPGALGYCSLWGKSGTMLQGNSGSPVEGPQGEKLKSCDKGQHQHSMRASMAESAPQASVTPLDDCNPWFLTATNHRTSEPRSLCGSWNNDTYYYNNSCYLLSHDILNIKCFTNND